MSCEITRSDQMYIFTLSEHFIMTNTPCSECFNKKYNHKVNQFIPVTDYKVEEWKEIISAYIPIKCECKKINV